MRHVLCHGGLPDIDAELEQFAMDPWCSPERVGDAHLTNELANVLCCAWPPTTPSRLPAPIDPETSTMPADHGLRLDKLQCMPGAKR